MSDVEKLASVLKALSDKPPDVSRTIQIHITELDCRPFYNIFIFVLNDSPHLTISYVAIGSTKLCLLQ